MNNDKNNLIEINQLKDFVNDGRFDDAVQTIALYIGDASEENYLDRLEEVIEALLTLHGGRTVLRFLIENFIIDIPSLLENLSKKDSVLRYTFLLLLKTICEEEADLFLPYSEDLLNSEDPNVREAALQLLIYMAEGETTIDNIELIKVILKKLSDEKEFVIEKAVQVLKAMGHGSPGLITKVLKDYAKEISNIPENEDLKEYIDQILKSIVSVDKIEEIVEEESVIKEPPENQIEKLKSDEVKEISIEKEESKILDKEFELKKKELEIKKRKLELEEKEKEIEEKVIQKKEEVLKLKEEILEKESVIGEEVEKKIPKKLKKKEEEIIDKEIELKKKDIEIKKKKLEIEEKEKELEEKEILEREKALKIKEELIEKEKELSQVEIELKQKSIEQKEQKLMDLEKKRVEEELKKAHQNDEEDDKN
ncbi:MAG: HEAT repeat domain-containing protein [Promethearchaeota archaeon]